jgi:U4/U6 small nuclear ribonucleoprotein PRP3
MDQKIYSNRAKTGTGEHAKSLGSKLTTLLRTTKFNLHQLLTSPHQNPPQRPPTLDPAVMDPSRKRPLADGTTSPAKRPKPAAGGPDQERIQKMMAEARAKAAAVAAKLAASKGVSASPSPSPAATPTPAQTAAERLAAMRSKVQNAVSRSAAASSAPPSRSASHTPIPTFRREEPDHDDGSKARGGLDVGLHPALLGDTADAGSSRRGKVAPKFATTMANRRPDGGRGAKPKKQLDLSAPSPDLMDPSKNPYYDPNIAAKSLQPRRIPKSLHFNEKGKYIEQANALRRQAALEEMKKRIALAARKAGIDEDMHADKAFAVSTPLFPISLYSRTSYANMQPI